MKQWLLLFCLIAAPAWAQTSLTGTTCPGAGCATFPSGGQGGIGVQVTGTFSGTLTFSGTASMSAVDCTANEI